MLALFLLIPGIRGAGGKYLLPHDSTMGVGPGFYYFAGAFLLFIIGGTLKAFWDDKEWRGRFMQMPKPKRKKSK